MKIDDDVVKVDRVIVFTNWGRQITILLYEKIGS